MIWNGKTEIKSESLNLFYAKEIDDIFGIIYQKIIFNAIQWVDESPLSRFGSLWVDSGRLEYYAAN